MHTREISVGFRIIIKMSKKKTDEGINSFAGKKCGMWREKKRTLKSNELVEHIFLLFHICHELMALMESYAPKRHE